MGHRQTSWKLGGVPPQPMAIPNCCRSSKCSSVMEKRISSLPVSLGIMPKHSCVFIWGEKISQSSEK